jgi:hypothetical protein
MQTLFRLRRFLDAPPARKAAGCELCDAEVPEAHSHVVDIEHRRLLCACRPCYLLFTRSGAGGGKYRSVPERVMKLEDGSSGARWEALDIPVGVAFLLRQSDTGRMIAFYPSPAGAMESLLPLDTWEEIAAADPLLTTLEPDIEALLVCRGELGIEAWIVPVDACYELVGRIRHQWTGFAGARDARGHIDAFLAGLRERIGA